MRHATPPSTARAVRLFTHFGIASLASLTFLSLPTLAGPVNPNVVSGAANFQQNGSHHLILVSNGAIINYDSFNISSIETVQFIQASSTSSVLNRITGGAPTAINGTLLSNGTVYFVNPAGIVFGNSAVVNVGGLVAAAADVSNKQYLDFVKGISSELAFTNLNGSVINHGTIHAQNNVHLLGRHVANHGLINVAANDGTIMMSAADGQIRLSQLGEHYSVQLDMTGAAVAGIGVENTGVLNAANGRVSLGAGDLYSLASIRLQGNGITGRTTEFNGNVRLGSDVAITTESAHFAGSLDSEAGGPARSLTIQKGGLYGQASATMDGPVGAASPLANLSADTDLSFNSSARFRGNVTAGRDATFSGPVALTAPGGKQRIQAGRDLRLDSTVSGAGADLDLAALNVFLNGDVSGVGALDVSGVTRLSANVTTSKGSVFNNAIILTGDSTITDTGTGGVHMLGTVDGPFAFTVASANGDALFGGNIGEITPLARFETAVGGTVVFEGNLVRAAGDILLNQNVQTVLVPAVATIGAAGDVHFVSLNGSFAMGQNQKLTAGGNLSISAANSATLGDMSSLGDMTVNANAILILTRNPGPVQDSLGVSTMDTGVDFVAGGRFFFSVVPVVLGNGPRPQFASPHLNADARGTLASFTMRLHDGVSPGDVRGTDGRYLDLRASGTAIADLRPVFLGDVTRDDDRGEIEDEVTLSATDAEALRRIAIMPRLLNDTELADFAAGRGVYIDAPSTRVFEAIVLMPEVSIERLSARRVKDTLAAYDRVRYMEVIDVDTGERTLVDQVHNVRGALEAAWDEYFAGAGASGHPAEFRAHLEAAGLSALAHLDGFRRLESEMKALGLTRAEIERAMQHLLEPFTPTSMTAEELHKALH